MISLIATGFTLVGQDKRVYSIGMGTEIHKIKWYNCRGGSSLGRGSWGTPNFIKRGETYAFVRMKRVLVYIRTFLTGLPLSKSLKVPAPEL